MKSNHLYFILLLIAVIIFLCIGFNNNPRTLEGFQDAHDALKKFDKSCISSCEKEAEKKGIDNPNEKCKKSCDKITKKCHYQAFNSPQWWNCLNSINPNIAIPDYILNEDLNIQDNSVDNSNYNSEMEEYLNGISNSSNERRVQHLQKENKRVKKLQKQFDKDQKLFNQDIEKTQKGMSQLHSGQGIPKSQIPFGDEDLYILKSEIVPPVCPACPTLNCGNCKTKCPPCPPCARCPEPAFKCEKVPNYQAKQTNPYLPLPWLNDFSQFGNYP